MTTNESYPHFLGGTIEHNLDNDLNTMHTKMNETKIKLPISKATEEFRRYLPCKKYDMEIPCHFMSQIDDSLSKLNGIP